MKKTQQVQTQSISAAVQQNKLRFQNCVNKWKKLLVSEHVAPIENKHTRAVTAVLLENQANALMEDMNPNSSSIWGANASFGGAITQGDTYAKGDNRLPKILLPMIRRTFPELISNEVVGVQPMFGPVSLAFAIRYRYDQGPLHEARSSGTLTKLPATGPQYGVDTFRAEDTANPPAPTDMRQLEATVKSPGTEMGYNYLDTSFTGRRNNLFNRTINEKTGAPYTDADIVTTWNASDAGATYPIKAVADLVIISRATVGVEFTLSDDTTKYTIKDNEGEGAKVIAAANALFKATHIAGGKFTFSDQDLGTAALLGDYEATGRIPRTKFTFEKKAVEAGTRRIGTSWTLELEQDIRNMNGIDIEQEVTSMMSYELQAEIDREMIVRMLYAALSANEYSYWDGSKADARWMGERDRAFYQFIIQMANRMAVRNRRGPANFIIATPDVCSLLETLPQYAIMEVNGTISTDSSGIAKVGTIGNGRFTVFRDTRTPVQNNSWMNNSWDNQGQYTVGGEARTQGIPDFALLGYKGSEYWDAGILFCPYIPILLQRVVDPVSFEPQVGLMTRYGVVDNLFGANLYYHVVLIDTLGNSLPPSGAPANNWPGTFPNGSALTDVRQQGGYPVQVTNTPENPVNTKPVA